MRKSVKPAIRVGVVVPHIFMHRQILPNVIFAPAQLAIQLCEGLQAEGANVTLYTPGPIDTSVSNITADLSYFERELSVRHDSYTDLLKKHPGTFITLARQVQSELIARAFDDANRGRLDLIHIYTNEEDIALPFVKLCRKPVVFTHHDPFNFLVKYRSIFPNYKHLNWLSLSMAQRRGMPASTNWLANIYHGLAIATYTPSYEKGNYVAFLGRIIEPKGVHLAIKAVKLYNTNHVEKIKLKIAGKHYGEGVKDSYWQRLVAPELDGVQIEYVGFINNQSTKRDFLANALALLVPSTFEEPFGLVMIEALACATPLIGLNAGAIAEIITEGETGFVVKPVYATETTSFKEAAKKVIDEGKTAAAMANALARIDRIKRSDCRQDFENRFTLKRMCKNHLSVYQQLITK